MTQANPIMPPDDSNPIYDPDDFITLDPVDEDDEDEDEDDDDEYEYEGDPLLDGQG